MSYRGRWVPDEYLEYEGVVYQYKGRTADDLHLSVVRHHDQWPMTLVEGEVVVAFYSGRAKRILPPGDVTITTTERTRAFEKESPKTKAASNRRRAYMELYAISGIGVKTGPKVRALIDELAAIFGDPTPPSEATFVRWVNRCFPQGVYDAELNRVYFGNRGSKKRLNPIAEKILREEIVHYKTKVRTPRKTKSIDELANLKLKSAGLNEVSRATVYRRARDLNAVEAVFKLRGWTEARKLLPFGDAPQSRRILECSIIDHTPLDIYVLSPCRRYILERPIITALIDDYSGIVQGWHIGFKPPSAWTVMLAMRHAMKPKDDLHARYPLIQNRLPTHGYISALRCDNGPEFHGDVLWTATKRMGTALIWCAKGNPWLKGSIENLFHVLNSELRQIPGAIFDRATFLGEGEYDPKKAAIFTMDELLEYVAIYFCDYFHLLQDPKTKLTRLDVWNADAINNPPYTPSYVDQLDIILSRAHTGTLGPEGIRINGLKYMSRDPEFEALYGDRPIFGRKAFRPKVECAIDDSNVGAIHVLARKNWIRVPCTQGNEYDGMSRDLLDAINAATLNAKGDYSTMLEGERRQTRRGLEDMIESAEEKTVQSHRLTREIDRLAKRRKRDEAKANELLKKPQEPIPDVAAAPNRAADMRARLDRLLAESGAQVTVDEASR